MFTAADDERWFQDNPQRRYWLRRATDEEIKGFIKSNHDLGEMKMHFTYYTIVLNDGRQAIIGTRGDEDYVELQNSDERIIEILADNYPELLR